MSHSGIELLFNTARDLQKERQVLEQRLKERRSRRTQLESSLERLRTKYHQVKDVNTKMTETLKVAQYKVMETQNQLRLLEETNIQKRASLSELNAQLKMEKESQHRAREDFEHKLARMAEMLIDAKNAHTDVTLKSELSAVTLGTKKHDHKSDQKRQDILETELQLNKLKLNEGEQLPNVSLWHVWLNPMSTLDVWLYNKNPCAGLLWHWSSQGHLALCNPQGR